MVVWQPVFIFKFLMTLIPCCDAVDLIIAMVRQDLVVKIHSTILDGDEIYLRSIAPDANSLEPRERHSSWKRQYVWGSDFTQLFIRGDSRSLSPKPISIPHYLRAYVQSGICQKSTFTNRVLRNNTTLRRAMTVPADLWNYFSHHNDSNETIRSDHLCQLRGAIVTTSLVTRQYLNRHNMYRTLCAFHFAFTPPQDYIDLMFEDYNYE